MTRDNHQIARAAGVVMAAFVFSNLVGLVRQILVSKEFGTQAVLDAFLAASTYPDLIFSLIAGGALASAFVPTLTGFLTRGDRKGGWVLSSAIVNLVFLVVSIISLLSIPLAPFIVEKLLAPEYSPEMQALTVSILRILLIAPTVFGISGIVMGILNAHQIFLWSALAPSMLWLGMIIGVLFLAPTMGIFGLAWGYVLGAFMHLGIQVPALLRVPARKYTAILGLRLPAVREVGRLMGPRLLGAAAVQINFVVNTYLATGMAVGSLAAIKYSWAIMTMPQVVIAQSIAIAALPTFSAQVARGELGKMRGSLVSTLRGIILLSLPATLGLIILRLPLITALFQRGAFTAESTELVAWGLIWYTVGLTGHGVVEILSRAFYAMHDTKTPVFIGVAAMTLNVLLSLVFAEMFDRIGWFPFGGLALANSLATALEMVALWAIMARRLSGLDWNAILVTTVKAGIAVVGMTLVLLLWLWATASMNVWFVLVGGILLGGGVYGLALSALRLPEISRLIGFIRENAARTR